MKKFNDLQSNSYIETMTRSYTKRHKRRSNYTAVFPKTSKTFKHLVQKTTNKVSSFLSSSLKMVNQTSSRALRRIKKIM